ncbi:RidA family protein [Microbacterium sp. LWH3-1.2]|uniref:RidA family protein n=1 Tax=Microbacterium sp. LWH3-1.2 TaxID=3135256 RepID=UPI003422627D
MGSEQRTERGLARAWRFREQTRHAFGRLEHVLAHESATWRDIVRMTAYVADASHIRTFFEVQRRVLGDAPPTVMKVAKFSSLQKLVEVGATAVVPLPMSSRGVDRGTLD